MYRVEALIPLEIHNGEFHDKPQDPKKNEKVWLQAPSAKNISRT